MFLFLVFSLGEVKLLRHRAGGHGKPYGCSGLRHTGGLGELLPLLQGAAEKTNSKIELILVWSEAVRG